MNKYQWRHRNWLFNWYVNDKNQITKKQLRLEYKILLLLFVLALSIYLLVFSSYGYNPPGIRFFLINIRQLFGFKNSSFLIVNRNLVGLSFEWLWLTIKLTATGTILGNGLALVTAFLGAKKLKNWWWGITIRLGILFLRAFPTIIFSLLFTSTYNAELAGILIIFWVSWLWLHKYFIEIFENLDLSFYRSARSLGSNFFLAFKNEIYFRIKDRIYSLFFFSFESNIRWISLLAALGVPGIGQLIYEPIVSNVSWTEISIPLLILISFSLLLEFFSVILNKYLIKLPSKTLSKRYSIYSQQFRWQTILLYGIFLLFVIVMIYQLITVRYTLKPGISFLDSFSRMFFLDWAKAYAFDSASPLFETLVVLQQALAIILFVFVFGFVFAILQNERINHVIFAFFIKTLLTILRILPGILFFYLINPIVDNAVSTTIITLTIISVTNISKQLSLSINHINFAIYYQYKLEHKNYLWIVTNYIYPQIKKDRISLFSFEFENIIRHVIFFGIFGSSALGGFIQTLFNRKLYSDLGTYIWPVIFLIMIIDLISAAIRSFDFNNWIQSLNCFVLKLKTCNYG